MSCVSYISIKWGETKTKKTLEKHLTLKILFPSQHICRSATLAGWGELYGRTGYNYIFSGECSAVSSVTQNKNPVIENSHSQPQWRVRASWRGTRGCILSLEELFGIEDHQHVGICGEKTRAAGKGGSWSGRRLVRKPLGGAPCCCLHADQ